MDPKQGKSILIIEDNPGDQLLLHENLLSTNLLIADIVMVETLEQGIDCISGKHFSLIFLDLFLPDSTGLDSFKELIKSAPRVPVIIYSGLSDTQIALKAISLGAQDFLIKGDYTVGILEKTIRYSIERKSNLEALEKSNEKYNLVSKATNDMVWDWDLVTGKIHRNADGWRKIFRTPVDKEVNTGENWELKVHPEDRDNALSVINELISSDTQELFEMEFRILREDNTIGYIQDKGYISRDEKGKAIRLIGASHDITERKNAEEKILQREHKFRYMVQNGSDLIGLIDMHENYLHAGGSIKKVTGYESASLVDKTPYSFIHRDDWKIIKAGLSDIREKTFLKMPAYRYKNAKGAWRWMETTLTNLLGNPAVNGIIANSRDITETKIASDEIEKLSLVAKNTLNGVFILDTDKKITWINEAFTKITGFAIEDAIGKRPLDLLHGSDPAKGIYEVVVDSLSKKSFYEGETSYYTKAGKPICIWLQVTELYDEQGEVKQYFGVQTDITDKKLAENELKKLSMVAKETINGVIISDVDQNVIWVNAAFTRMYGYEFNEVVGKNPVNYLPGNETDADVLGYLNEQLKTDKPFIFEIINYTKLKIPIQVRVQVQPIFDDEGGVKQFFSLHTDITKEKELEKKVELEKIIKQREITEAVFAAQESERSEIGREMHDNVNQLLGATRLYIDMAKRDDENRDSLLVSASTYTLNAIEEIRKLSKTLITPLIKEIGLSDSVKDLAEELMFVHPIRIEFTVTNFNEEELSDKFKLNIFRIIQEQVNNILKHAQAKQIFIGIEDNYGKILISVSDNGIGFDPNSRKKGVGLTNIKSRTELFNGSVLLDSRPGKGTTLSMTFDRKDL